MAAKYIAIAREIKKRIISRQYSASEPLPDQFALAAELGTSRMTIQQAMRQIGTGGYGQAIMQISCVMFQPIVPRATMAILTIYAKARVVLESWRFLPCGCRHLMHHPKPPHFILAPIVRRIWLLCADRYCKNCHACPFKLNIFIVMLLI